MFEAIGIAGIALLWYFTLQQGQINHWVTRLVCRLKYGVWISSDDCEGNILQVVREWAWLKSLGYCPVCFGFWLSLILCFAGVILWYHIGVVYLSIKIYTLYEDYIIAHS